MAHMAMDGKKFTNKPPMMAHNRSMERQGGMAQRTDPLQQPAMGEGGQDDPAQVAQEHGPAVEVNIMHNHESGQHHVHSKHPDGHEHQAEHPSAEEAHEHGKMLSSGAEHEDAGDMDDEQAEYE